MGARQSEKAKRGRIASLVLGIVYFFFSDATELHRGLFLSDYPTSMGY